MGLPLNLLSGDSPNVTSNFILRLARVIRVDHENMLLDAEYLDKGGIEHEIPIVASGASHRALSITVPEINSIVLLGYIRMHGSLVKPVILSNFIPGYRSKVNFAPYRAGEAGDPHLDRFRGRRLYPGEVYHSSAQGSEIHLSDDILIENKNFATFKLLEENTALVTRSIQSYHADSAIRTWSGIITRNDFEVIDPTATSLEEGVDGDPGDITASGLPPIYTSTGSKFQHVCIDGTQTIDDGGIPFGEFRFSLEELTEAVPPVTAELHGFDFQISDPRWRQDPHQLMEMNFGTLVGDDPIYEPDHYGRVLVPNMLKGSYYSESDTSNKIQPNLHGLSYSPGTGWLDSGANFLEEEIVDHGSNFDKKLNTAAAIRFRMRNDKSQMTYFSLSKEGKAHIHLGRSSDLDPLGAGRSVEAVFEGSARFVLGRNANQGHSLFQALRGSHVAHIGSCDQDNTRTRDKALYRDGTLYGQHGYHDLLTIVNDAPIPNSNVISNPTIEGYSADLIFDRNIHIIIGADDTNKKSLAIDGEGSLLAWMGADINGHSFSLHGDGALEMQLGKDNEHSRSINLSCLGGIQIHARGGDSHVGQSLHMNLARGVQININEADDEGYGYRINIRGSVQVAIEGQSVQTSIKATEKVEEIIESPTITRVYVGDVTDVITGNYKQLISGNRLQITGGSKIYT